MSACPAYPVARQAGNPFPKRGMGFLRLFQKPLYNIDKNLRNKKSMTWKTEKPPQFYGGVYI